MIFKDEQFWTTKINMDYKDAELWGIYERVFEGAEAEAMLDHDA